MKKLLLTFAALLLLVSSGCLALAREKFVISIEQLQKMFTNMRTNPGSNKWNVDGPLLWGYFFTDPNFEKLKLVADALSSKGYRFVSIYPTDDKSTFFLHVEKVEHHTPESLNIRNIEFDDLADRFNLESYDGMDVGLVGK